MTALSILMISIISLCRSDIITPNSDDGYIQIYDTSQNNEYRYNEIICNTSICHIICDLEDVCKSLTIDASQSDSLILDCMNRTACDSLIVSNGPTISADIHCSYPSGCSSAYFNLRDTLIIYQYCCGDAQGVNDACDEIEVHAENAQNVTIDYSSANGVFYVNYTNTVQINSEWKLPVIYGYYITDQLTMNCNTTNCGWGTIHCPYYAPCNIFCPLCGYYNMLRIWIPNKQYDNLHWKCDDSNDGSCGSVGILCDTFSTDSIQTAFAYNDQYYKWQCSSYECCLWEDGYYECPDGVECIIDCSTQSCVNWVIDATNSTSLTVECKTGCQGAKIKCPQNEYAICDIQCPEEYSCQYVLIETPYNALNDSLYIQCSGDWACYGMSIYMQSQMVDTFSLCCSGDYACNWMTTKFNFESIKMWNWTINVSESYHFDSSTFTLYINPYNLSIDSMNIYCNIACFDSFMLNSPNVIIKHLEVYGVGIFSPVQTFEFAGTVSESAIISADYLTATFDLELLNSNTMIDINCTECRGSVFNIYSTTSISNTSEQSVSVICTDCDERSSFIFTNIGNVMVDIKKFGGSYGSNDHHTLFAKDTNALMLRCDGSVSCYKADIYCPYVTKGSCKIECIGSYSCKDMTVNTVYGNESYIMDYLDLSCDGESACNNTDIYCPYVTKGSCKIDCISLKSCEYMTVYVNQSYIMDYLDLSCNNNTADVQWPDDVKCDTIYFDCYKYGTYITLTESKINPYQCTQQNSTPNCCPFTIIPTIEPTIFPTIDPTIFPSREPTAPTTSTTSYPTYYDFDDTSTTSIQNKINFEFTTDSFLFYIVMFIGSIGILIAVACIYYIIFKLRVRSKQPGNASYINMLKTFKIIQYIGLILDLFDVGTDYLYAASLIILDNKQLNTLGWISLIFAVFGVSILFFKYSTHRKLVSLQSQKLKKELESSLDHKRVKQIIKELRYREMDINVISLLNGCIEDIPQTLIVLIATSNVPWDYISILTLSLSMISFTLKLSKIGATKLGCCDESAPDSNQVNLSFVVEATTQNKGE